MPRDSEPVNRPLRIVANPRAGRGRARRRGQQLAAALAERGIESELTHTSGPGDATRLAAAADGIVVAVGGDGTVHEVLNGLVERSGRLGPLAILPSGSGDDFASGAAATDDPAELAAALVAPAVRSVDYGIATITTGQTTLERRFANEVGVGFEAEVVRATRRLPLRGRALYVAATLRALLRQRPFSATLAVDDQQPRRQRLLLASFGNGPRVGGGLPFSPDARIDDGVFDLLAVAATSRLGTLILLRQLMHARHRQDHRVHTALLRRASLALERPTPVAMDGELITENADELRVEIRPGSLDLIATKGALRTQEKWS